MIDQISGGPKAIEADGKRRWVDYVVLSAICALVIGVYIWSAYSGIFELLGSKAGDSYYNLLVQGFRAGQLNLKTEVPPELAQLADPFDPNASFRYRLLIGHPVWDMSYYRGKLYLYFGVTPALVLFWPYAALTGHYLLHKDAVVIFCAAGFLASVGLLWALWRRHFAEVSLGVVAGGAVALGLATGLPVMLQRSDVYEVAIGCGYALVMLTLAALWRALQEPQRRGWWLAAASLAYGLAVGARPSLLFGALILLVPIVQASRAGAEHDSPPRVWVLVLAAIGPILLIGLGLMLYNALRFGNPFVFGGRYQLSGLRQSAVQPFSPGYLWFNFRVYFLEPAHWSGHFPFAGDISVPRLPAGHAEVEHPYGVLTNVPLVWLALCAPLIWRGRTAGARSVLRWMWVAVALFFGISALTLGLFFAACLRYEVEFLPALMVLAVMGIFGLERALAGRPFWRQAARAGWALLLVASVAFNLLASLGRQADFHCALGSALLKQGQLDAAIGHLQKALELQPDIGEASFQLGTAFYRKGQASEAIIQFQKALESETNSPQVHNNLANALLQIGRPDEAIAHYQRAVQLQPDDVRRRVSLGGALLRRGRVDEAILQFQAALAIEPLDALAHYHLGNAFLQQGRMDAAIAHFEKTLELQPANPDAHNNVGVALVQKTQLDEAIAHYHKALEMRPDFAEAHNNLANALLQKGDVDEAVVHYQRVLEIQPDDAWCRVTLGSALLRKGRVDEANFQFQTALRLRPEDVALRNSLGSVLLQDGQLDEAIAYFKKALELQPTNADAHNNVGVALLRKGEVDAAISHYREALRLNPGLAEARTNLDAALGMKQVSAEPRATSARP